MKQSHKFVRYALEIGAMELLPDGRELKSKRISPYFFNTGLFTTGDHLFHLTAAYAHVCIDGGDVVFGPAYKGIPLAVGITIALVSGPGINLGWACNRKELKDHGEGGVLIGHSLQGHRIIIADDVITGGITAEETISFVKKSGGIPSKYVIAFDRQEQGKDGAPSAVQEVQEKYGIPVVAAATLADLIEVLEEDAGVEFPLGPIVLPKIYAYREKYGTRA